MITKLCLVSVAGLLWKWVFCPMSIGWTVSCFFPRGRGFFLLLFSQRGWVCICVLESTRLMLLSQQLKSFRKAGGLFAFLAVVVSLLLYACPTEVGFPLSRSPLSLSGMYSEGPWKRVWKECEFTLCLGLPGLLYFMLAHTWPLVIC